VKGSGAVLLGRARSKFSINVNGGPSAVPSGKLSFVDSNTRRKFVSSALTALTINGRVARIYGTVTVNGANPVAFMAEVEDLGSKPKLDKFRLELATGETFGPGVLASGTIKVTP
jgi:hypothetical protein